MADPKCLFYDIESSSLNASFGTILCIGYHWLGEPDDQVKVPLITDFHKKKKDPLYMLDDKKLVEHFKKIWEWSDYVCGHYSRRFDYKMLNTKCLEHGLGPLVKKPHVDTWLVFKREFKLHSNRLGAIEDFLGVEHSKTPLSPRVWRHAAMGCPESLALVQEHCRQDVLVLRDVFLKIRAWVSEEPSRQLFVPDERGNCVSCGSTRIIGAGHKVTKTRRYQQFRCADCGKYQANKYMDKEVQIELVG